MEIADCSLNVHRQCVRVVEESCTGPLVRKEKGNDRISKLMDRIRLERKPPSSFHHNTRHQQQNLHESELRRIIIPGKCKESYINFRFFSRTSEARGGRDELPDGWRKWWVLHSTSLILWKQLFRLRRSPLSHFTHNVFTHSDRSGINVLVNCVERFLVQCQLAAISLRRIFSRTSCPFYQKSSFTSFSFLLYWTEKKHWLKTTMTDFRGAIWFVNIAGGLLSIHHFSWKGENDTNNRANDIMQWQASSTPMGAP